MSYNSNGSTIPNAVGKAVSVVLGAEGDTLGGLQPAMFPISVPALMRRYNLSGSADNVLTLPIIQSGTLTGTAPGNTTVSIPTLATLGFTRPSDASADLFIRYQILAGTLFFNPAAGANVIIRWLGPSSDQMPQYTMGQLVFCGTDSATGKELWIGQ